MSSHPDVGLSCVQAKKPPRLPPPYMIADIERLYINNSGRDAPGMNSEQET